VPELDAAKEEISYLKLWLGIMVATGISLIAWLLTNFRSAYWLFVGGGLAAMVLIALGCIWAHLRIRWKIEDVRRL